MEVKHPQIFHQDTDEWSNDRFVGETAISGPEQG